LERASLLAPLLVRRFQFPVPRWDPELKRATGNAERETLEAAASRRTPNKALTFEEAARKIDGVDFPLLMIYRETEIGGICELPILQWGNIPDS